MAAHRIVIIDNYDSFAYNLYQHLGELTGVQPRVWRNDKVTLNEILEYKPTHAIISPGPGTPEDPAYFGVSGSVISTLGRTVPVLGVCLGHQGIAVAFGGRVVPAPCVMHGKTSDVAHEGTGLFEGLPSPMRVMRYHSLMIDSSSLPSELRVTSRTADGLIMSVVHDRYPIAGVQFHPESIGTEHGMHLLSNFLAWEPRNTPVKA